MADQHFRVHKQVTEQPLKSGKLNQQEQHHNGNSKTETAALRTIVQVHVLNAQQRLEELALLAGGQSGQETIAFAESLLAKAAHLRQQPTPPTEKSLAPPSQSKTASVKPKKNRSKSAIP
jgi:DNA repair protein RecN (Recombination protein N)